MAASLIDEARAVIGIGSAITATGVLIALAGEAMSWWSLVVFATPLLLTQFSFRRYASIRATYLQTIRSLSKVTEVGGYTETGHSRRVSRLAVAVGREMGVPERDLTDLEYAALMHDIGQLSLPTPIPGGTTTILAAVDQRLDQAQPHTVVRQVDALLERIVGVLDAEHVELQHHARIGQAQQRLDVEDRAVVILPKSNAEHPERRYPVLYSVSGFGGTVALAAGGPPRPLFTWP